MNIKMRKILIVAGEASGDLHGGNLVRSIKSLNPDIHFFGIGGNNMKSAGVELLYHIDSMAFMGFVEVIRHIPFLTKVKKDLLTKVKEFDVDAVILIDYPGFNLSLAKDLKKLHKKIFYYISPQLWAWGKNRLKLIKELIHKMIVVFPFEEKMYREAGINVAFVGHPLIDVIEQYKFEPRNDFFEQFKIDPNKKIITIFPGSRRQEIYKILPITIESIKLLRQKFDLEVLVAGVDSINKNVYEKFCGNEAKLVFNKNYELMKYADAGIIKSGTSTLEAALFGLPFVVVYRTSFLSYLIGKSLIQIDKISLANIVADKKVVTELIQNICTPEKIASEVEKILLNENYRNQLKTELSRIKSLLGKSGSSIKAAEIILSEI